MPPLIALGFTVSSIQDLPFNPPIELLAPEQSALASPTPTLFWQDYTAHPPAGPWSYVVHLDDPSNGTEPPGKLLALRSTTTAIDLATPPAPPQDASDAGFHISCLHAGGSYAHDTAGQPACNGATAVPFTPDVSSSRSWDWGVAIYRSLRLQPVRLLPRRLRRLRHPRSRNHQSPARVVPGAFVADAVTRRGTDQVVELGRSSDWELEIT